MPIVLFFISFFVYFHNLSRSVYGGDTGDLITAAYTFGVPHPPGYPLFTFLGFLLTRFSSLLHQTPAFMVGLISAFSSAVAVMMYYIFARELTKRSIVALISSLTVAFTFLFWFYAEIAEVFALNNLFAVSLLFLSYVVWKKRSTKYLYLLSFVAGLSLTNHHTIILIFPSLLLITWSALWQSLRKSRLVVLWCLFFGMLGFSFYLYPVIASQTNPLIDWGNITSVSSFLDLVLRKKYGTFQLAAHHDVTPTARMVVLKTYFLTLLSQLTIPVVLLSLLGMISFFRQNRNVAIALFLAFVLTGPFFVTYAGFYLSNSFYFGIYERFLSLSSVIFLLFFPVGLLSFTSTLGRFFSRKEYLYFFQGVFIIIPLMLFVYNFPKTNLSNVWIGDELGENYLIALPPHSILYLSGDTNLFNTQYVRYARNVRSDTAVYNGLSPDKTIEIYGQQFGKTKSTDFIDVINKLDATKPIFSDLRFQDKNLKGEWVPYGLFYEFRASSEGKLTLKEYQERTRKIWNAMKLPSKKQTQNLAQSSYTIAIIPEMYANALVVAGNYFLSEYQQGEAAKEYYFKAIAVDPFYSKAYATLGAYYFTDEKNCSQAIPYLKKALNLYQFDMKYYYLLYLSYKECKVSKNNIEALERSFFEQFRTPLIQSIKEYDEEKKAYPKDD